MEHYIDPILLDKITYLDKSGKRRVKNPYRNRRSYPIIVPSINSEGNFVMTIPGEIAGQSVYVEYPGKASYRFVVSAATGELTVIGIPVFTYIEVHVVNPRSLPPSDDDLAWDSLGYDAQKSIMAAWGDIDLICNVLYPSTAESELNFDDQNTLKYGLIGFRNNCGNLRNAGWGYKDIPKNGRYFPPQPEPTPPPPAAEPKPADPEIGHQYDLKFVLRWENSTRTDLDLYAFVDHSANKKVWYNGKTYGSGSNQMWLDRDFVSHDPDGRENQPEIVTVLGLKRSTVSIQLNNYNKLPIHEAATLEILTESQDILKSYTIPASAISGERSYWICDVEVGTLNIIDKQKVIQAVGTFV